MNEKLHPSETSKNIIQARKSIIDSILSNGLRSGRELENGGISFIKSTDPIPYSSVFGCEIRSVNDIQAALYQNSESVLPVLAERSHDLSLPQILRHQNMSEEENLRYISERICSSIMVVCNLEDMKGVIAGITLNGIVPAENIQSFVFPENIWNEYNNISRNDTGVPKVIKVKTTEKYLTAFEHVMKVPDYESFLRTKLEENATPLWISGVRLPAHIEDLK